MKKFLMIATAALMVAAPALADDHRGGHDWDRDGDHERYEHRDNWRGGGHNFNPRNMIDRWALVNFDFNRDGRLDRREYALSQRVFFDLADRNNDGVISDKDWRKFIDKYAYRNDIGYRYGGYRDQPRNAYGYNNDPWRR
jgi:hypothetical protein